MDFSFDGGSHEFLHGFDRQVYVLSAEIAHEGNAAGDVLDHARPAMIAKHAPMIAFV